MMVEFRQQICKEDEGQNKKKDEKVLGCEKCKLNCGIRIFRSYLGFALMASIKDVNLKFSSLNFVSSA